MIDTEDWKWVCDKSEMVCRNVENSIVVKIDKTGKTYNGKLLGIPLELFGRISKVKHGEKIIQNIIKSAEEEFFRACTGSIPLGSS